ncbi:ERF family protein [Lysinibacillus macroides]|uniref:ERF family protein n=1 Tax=Lysinibacillus macroides TaxID=33935 RepID=UPI0006B6432A|nr:ERF family protein [Lysinibacillus macroides]QPR68522.1 ERF family protein [Lysinibacillus macroides]
MIFSESNTNIAAALAKSWAVIQTPKHNTKVEVRTKTGRSYTFEYTDLNGILDAVKPVFVANKLTIMQNSYTQAEGNTIFACVETIILHESGEYAKSFPLKFPAANSMQDFGGQITYMKRYSLAAMLGLATEKDDDANGMSGNDYAYQQQPPPQNQPPVQESAQQSIDAEKEKMSGAQYTELKKALAKVAQAFGADVQTVYNGALQACWIPDKHSKSLTAKEANMLINHLLSTKVTE